VNEDLAAMQAAGIDISDFATNAGMSTIAVDFSTDPAGYWECSCGNVAERDGFYPATPEGVEVEPTPEDWDGEHWVCARCDQVYRDTPDGVVPVARHG
jgi:hypothetical protein